MAQTATSTAPDSAPSSEHPRRILASVVGVWLVVFVLVTAFVLGAIAVMPTLGFALSDPIPFVLLGTVPQFVMLIAGYWYMSRRLGWLPVQMPSLSQGGLVVLGVVAVLVLQIVISVVFSVLSIPPQASVITEAGETDPTAYLLVAVLSILIVGPAEEFLYRGAFQGHLRTAFGPVVAITVPAALFGVMHLPNYLLADASILSIPLWLTILSISLSGLVFGYFFERTGNLVVPILVHGLTNVLVVGITLLTGL